jgi:hypothetical protein
MNGIDSRMATPDGYASLPYDTTLPNTRPVEKANAKRRSRASAVRVDLSFADSSIRRPGSAPDLANKEATSRQHSPGGCSIRSGTKTLIDRGRSTSSERESVMRKLGAPGTPGTRKVAFAGIEDESDSSETSTETESAVNTVNSFDEEVWVKQPEVDKPPVEAPVATSGVVIAGALPQQNKCNGNAIR